MRKLLSKRVGAILTAAAMLAALLPMAMPVMAEDENLLVNGDFSDTVALEEAKTFTNGSVNVTVDAEALIPEGWTLETDANLATGSTYTFADGKANLGNGFVLSQYVEVEEGEHYSFTPTKANNVFCGVQVEFYNYSDGVYTPVNVNANLYSPTGVAGTVDTVSNNKVRKACYTENDFKFTTPITCNVVKVALTSYHAGSKKKAGTVQGATLTVTDEVVTNGTFTRYSGTASAGNVGSNMDGWCAANADQTVKKPLGAFRTGNYAGAEQGVLLKANSTYKFSFKFAQNGANGTAPAIALVAQGTSAPINLKFHKCNHCVTTTVEKNTSLANDYTTYEVIFTTSGEEGTLGNYVIKLPKTSSSNTWYDDISIMEIDTVTRVLPIYADATTTSFASTDVANGIRYSYVQDVAGKTQKLIRATYEGEALVDATVLTPGADLEVGEIADYDAVYSDAYTTKIFLWDGATLAPVWADPIVNEIAE